MPTSLKKVEYKKLKNIDFTSAKKKRKALDTLVDPYTPSSSGVTSKFSKTQINIPKPTQTEFSNCCRRLYTEEDKKPAVLKVSLEQSKYFIPKALSDDIPDSLDNLFNPSLVEATLPELLNLIHSCSIKIEVTPDQVKAVEGATRGQAENNLWFKLRTGRITASRMKSVCHTSVNKPSITVLNNICQPLSRRFETEATSWGRMNEKKARNEYEAHMSLGHQNFIVSDCGLMLNEKYPYFGASPDGFVSCDCCGNGVIEIKCPFKFREGLIADVLSDNKSCLELIDGNVRLKKGHEYMYQVQTQLHMCNVEYVEFVLWTKKDMHVERIERDNSMWDHICDKGRKFFYDAVLPELLGKYFSKPRNEE